MAARGCRSDAAVIVVFCLAQTLAQLGAFTFPALLPLLIDEWRLSHTDAGWLSGIFFGAYAVSVPVLVTLTDRIDARRIYLCAVGASTVSHLGLAFLADGFWAGLAFRVAAGVGWAGTYMVGLRALTDQMEGRAQTRAVAAHAASIGVSGALSFVIAGQLAAWLGWQSAFVVSAAGTLGAMLVAGGLFPATLPPRRHRSLAALLDFRPVFANRSAMAYSIAYCVHTWEMFVVRSWVVTFLAFVLDRSAAGIVWLVPTVVAMLMELAGTASSVLGNEVALRIGRRRWIVSVMAIAIILACCLGFASTLGYVPVVVLCLIYNAVIYADSASLTAGTAGSAHPDRRGATLAVHAMLGYGGGFVGPLMMGVILDGAGGESVLGWGVGFAHVAVIMLVGPLVMIGFKPVDPGRP